MEFNKKSYIEKSIYQAVKSHFKFHREVSIDTTLWLNDTPGVFEYENENIISNHFTLKGSDEKYFLVMINNSYNVLNSKGLEELNKQKEDFIHIIDLTIDNESIYINPRITNGSNEHLWMMVKSNQSEISLEPGTLIKLGRSKLLVRRALNNVTTSESNITKEFYDFLNEIDSQDKSKSTSPLLSPLSENESDDFNLALGSSKQAFKEYIGYNEFYHSEPSEISFENIKSDIINNKHEDGQNDNKSSHCRICLSDEDVSENPLLSPCNCRGSMGSIHLMCLRTWMQGLLEVRSKNNDIASFFIHELSCELCKTKYPHLITKNSINYQLMDIAAPVTPYIILENLSGTPGFHILPFTNKKSTIIIGRSLESADVRIPNSSVSRSHASIKFNKNKFILEDHNSKFGTYVQIDKPLRVDLNNSRIDFQIGKSLISIKLRKTFGYIGSRLSSPKFKYEIPNSIKSDQTFKNYLKSHTTSNFIEI